MMLLACAVSAQAFSFEPITQDYATTGARASHVFRVANTTDSRIAVRIAVRPRRIEPDGTEILGKEAEEFTVFPRQMLLAPGERRSIRVRWSGPETIERELAYRIIAEQVPVEMGTDEPLEGGGIRLTYRYEGTLYVVPPGAEPDVAVESAGVVTTADGAALRVRLVNRGTRHALLSGARLLLADGPDSDARLELGPEELDGIVGENMLAGSVRDFLVPAPDDLRDGSVHAEIEYDDK